MRQIPQERQPEAVLERPLLRDDFKFAAGRIAAFQYVTVAAFLFLVSGFWDLQIRNEETYNEKAQANQIKSLPIPAPRGRLLDRDGRVLVDNHSSYRLILSRDNLREEHLRPIADGLNLDYAEFAAKVRRFRNRPSFYTIPVKDELTPEELTFVEANRGVMDFPELEVIKSQQRLYPRGGFAAHLIGYVGEISEAELNSPEWARYDPGDIIGKMGVERYYNEILTGRDGQRQVRVDNRGNAREVLGTKPAEPGRDLQLTIDLDLQAVAELAMQNRRGAVVALDPRTGEVLAFVSTPAYDSNQFLTRAGTRQLGALFNDPHKPFFNRGIQSQLAPGSTFKPIVLLAGLQEGVIDPSFTVTCGGGATYYGRYFKCHKKGGHGTVDVTRAMAQSCDVFFYAVGNRLGIDKLAHYATMAGFGAKTGIDLPQEKEGIVPSSRWKIRTQREKWYAGETISVAIGQGALTVTPLQLAHAIGGLAMRGTWMRPHVVATAKPEVRNKVELDAENVARVVNGMYAVVNEGGTGGASRLPGIEFCGKTGTAQKASNEALKNLTGDEWKDNAWFVGFAPKVEPEIVVAALFENGEHGNLAGPIVRDVIKAYFDKRALKVRSAQPKNLALQVRPTGPVSR